MANTLTDLFPDIYRAWDVVSREMIGFIPAVSLDAGMDRVAKDQTIRSFVAPASTASDFSPGQLAPNSGDQTIGNVTMTISKERYVPIRWNGNEQMKIDSSYGYRRMFQDQLEQAMRTLVNEVEADIAGLYAKASRAVDPAGTNLFDAANYKDIANVRQILAENGAPMNDVNLVLSPSAAAAFRGNAQYYGADVAGRDDFLRQGVLMNIHGINIRESQEVDSHTAGTASSATTDNAGYSIGDTVITLDSAGTGTILAGDIITFNGDTNEYVVASGDADVSNGGTITLAAPGLKKAIAASTTAITVQSDAERNMCFSRNAIHLATRLLAMPDGGDAADDQIVVRDPRSGIAIEVRVYREFGQVVYLVGLAYGFEMIKPEHAALLVD